MANPECSYGGFASGSPDLIFAARRVTKTGGLMVIILSRNYGANDKKSITSIMSLGLTGRPKIVRTR